MNVCGEIHLNNLGNYSVFMSCYNTRWKGPEELKSSGVICRVEAPTYAECKQNKSELGSMLQR